MIVPIPRQSGTQPAACLAIVRWLVDAEKAIGGKMQKEVLKGQGEARMDLER